VNLRLADAGIVLLLAVGSACLGDLILWRRSRALGDWNESFLIGAGTLSIALAFPLSPALGRRAFWAAAAVLASTVAIWLLTAARRPAASRRNGRLGLDAPSLFFAACVVAAAGAFAALNARRVFDWDGFAIWATKAQVLFHDGAFGPEISPNSAYLTVNYPPLVPFLEALLCRVRGAFDFDALKPVFLLFYVSMLLSTFRAARELAGARLALASTAILALLPAVSAHTSIGGYADMPQAAVVAAAAAACLREPWSGPRSPAPWLLGALLSVKNEGFLLLGAAGAAMVFAGSLDGFRPLVRRIRNGIGGFVVVGAFLAVRWGYLSWAGLPDDSFIRGFGFGHAVRALRRIPDVARLCAADLLNPALWDFFWPAAGLALAYLLLRGTRREKGLAAGTCLAAVIYIGIFLLTDYYRGYASLIEQDATRLFCQIAPASAVGIAAAYGRARRAPDATIASS